MVEWDVRRPPGSLPNLFPGTVRGLVESWGRKRQCSLAEGSSSSLPEQASMRYGPTPRRRPRQTLQPGDGHPKAQPTPVPSTVLSLLVLALAPSGCKMVGAGPDVPAIPPRSPRSTSDSHRTPSPSLDRGAAGREIAGAVVETALEAIGAPYKWGGTSANGFDCSGLIRFAYGKHGVDLPRMSVNQLRMGSPVKLRLGALRPGDVLGFSATPEGQATHVGLYVGDGRFIHSSTGGVRISDLWDPYWQEHFVAARRMVRQ